MLIAGSTADTYYYSQQAFDQAKEPKELYTIEGASHVALYDTPKYVAQIVKKLEDFYGKSLL